MNQNEYVVNLVQHTLKRIIEESQIFDSAQINEVALRALDHREKLCDYLEI